LRRRSTEHPNESQVGGWKTPLLVTAFIIVWCLMIYAMVGDRPVDWQYGVLPYVPSQTFLSTRAPSHKAIPPKQVEYPSAIRERQSGD
jgi:hypothetical protein